ncbi:conserved hypothetical protein [delta proteobacterium NaphS2]|nr:conserved hypothetical protein [delta proteobacterium NaphS2]
MDNETLKTMSSPCGLPCFHCAAYLARENPEILERLVSALGVSPDKATCKGCRPQNGKIPLVNPKRTCEILLCTNKKEIDFCHECDDFPCERFQPYADQAHFPHNTKMYQLCMMKKLGFEAWAENNAAQIWDTYRTVPFSFDNILY